MTWQPGKLGWRLLPGTATALVAALLFKLSAWYPLEQLSYQALFRLRGPTAWDARVVVVAIDDASLKALGRFPWSRQRYAELLKVLTKADASVVAFDMLWSEPSAEDTQLASAMQQHRRVVVAQALDKTGVSLMPTPLLQESAIAVGHIHNDKNLGNLTQQVDLQMREHTALGIAAVQSYGLVQAPVNLPDLKQPFWINWPGPVEEATSYSFVKVLKGQIPPQALKDKIVLVGLTATGFDPLDTPFNSNPATSGIYLHAAVVNNLLRQNPLHRVPDYWLLPILIFGGPGLSFFLSHWRFRLRFSSWLGLSVTWVGLSVLLLWAGYWLPVALPLALFTGTLGTTLLCEQLRMSALLQRQVKHLWQTYTPEVVLDNRRSLQPMLANHLQQPVLVQQASQLAALAEQLGRSQAAQAAIARSLSSGLLAADLDGLVWFCNPVAATLLQIQVGDRLDHHLVPQWLSKAQWQADLQSLKAQQPISVHELHRGEHWLELKLEPLFYQPLAGEPTDQTQPLDGLLLILNDITERRLIEQMKSELVALVSHELRTPLTSIQGALKLLQTGKLGTLPAKGQRMLDIAAKNTNRLMRLTNDLLDLERIESGTVSLSRQCCQIADLLEQAAAVMQTMADEQSVVLAVHSVSATVWVDPDRLLQVLINLLSNAIKFSQPGGNIWLSAELRARALEHDRTIEPKSRGAERSQHLSEVGQHPVPYLLIRVKDEGRGIPADKLEAVFERFRQVEAADAQQKGGTGLGLAICRTIVQQHGGHIWVESESGQGCTFCLTLPSHTNNY